MTKHLRRCASIVGYVFLSGVACAQVPGTGRVQIEPIKSYSGASPLSKPIAIVVYNFAATPQEVELNHSALNRVRMHMSGAQDDEKAKLAHKIVDGFSESLVKDLQKTGLPVSRGVAGDLPPDYSLAVQGDFLLIDEGNRTRRMVIGLGTGASKWKQMSNVFSNKPYKM
jgi:hypothetical protein